MERVIFHIKHNVVMDMRRFNDLYSTLARSN